MGATLSPQLFMLFRQMVEEHVGLHQRQEDKEIFAEKVLGRMQEAGFESPLDYYYRLRYDDPRGVERDALVDALVVGETYLFRELDALRAAVDHVIKPAIEKRGAARVWSAACASGEEPLSLAMLLAEAGLLERCDILATDVSGRALARAGRAEYANRSLRLFDLNPNVAGIASRWMELQDRVARPRPELRRAILYQQDNLLGPPALREVASFDLVLCRNVLIYFADDTIRKVVTRLGGALRPNGRLLVGASESLLRLGTLQCEERGGTFFYKAAT